MDEDLTRLLADQDGVVSRRQLAGLGVGPADLQRLVRRRELSRVHPGVFVDHTGPLPWLQRAWAGVLWAWPAALTDESALRVGRGRGWRGHVDDEEPVRVVVAHRRRLVAPPGIVVRRSRDFDAIVRWTPGPARVRLEHAVVRVAVAAPDEWATIEVLAEACRSRRTTAPRLRAAIDATKRLPGRTWLCEVLDDVAAGSCSVLEHGYLTRVERAHGLPDGSRQVRDRIAGGVVYRDVEYAEQDFVVEIDGRLFHDTTRQRDRDLDRDLETLADGDQTARIGWGQVYARPCRTAELGRALRRRGWAERPRACGPRCGVLRAA